MSINFNKDSRIVITGAAGLLGQNLTTELLSYGYTNITAIDKHKKNLQILAELHPEVNCLLFDLAEKGEWMEAFKGADMLFLLQAQITGSDYAIFKRNTLDSTENVIQAAEKHGVPFTVFVGSSVVNSVADDNYTRSKKAQEVLIRSSSLNHCIARPTLMFGWFDPKHLGWLSRLMAKVPFFPIPGNGEYLRQPLFVLDFVRVLIWCAENRPMGKIYNIVGKEEVTYIQIIRAIKKAKKLRTLIIKIPVSFFKFLMNFYGIFCKNPPFVADQLDALMAGDYFTGDDLESTFKIKPTPFAEAINQTFTHPVYSKVVLER